MLREAVNRVGGCMLLAGIIAGLSAPCPGGDCPQWGGTPSRNMVSSETGLPASFSLAQPDAPAHNVRWVVGLGSRTYGTPVVADGRIYVGTNNFHSRDRKYAGDRSVLMCLRESDGSLLWQWVVPKIRTYREWCGDRRGLGVCSTPTVDGDRVYLAHRGEVLCLDVHGLADGNDGPFRDEAAYLSQPQLHRIHCCPGRPRVEIEPGPPATLGSTDADILWTFNMVTELATWPQDACNSAILVHGDYIYVGTSNGIRRRHGPRRAAYPDSPSLIALNKNTGRLVATDDAGIGRRIWHGQWSSPSLGAVHGRALVFYGGGDGYCYAFDAEPVPRAEPGPARLREVWRYDCNGAALRYCRGQPVRYNSRRAGPSEIIATPVFYHNRVYVAVGQDPTHGDGPGCLSCIDATREGDVSDSAKIWEYRDINRVISTVSIADGLVYVADRAGTVHCLDADTGQLVWKAHTYVGVYGSTLVADGKVYLGSPTGRLYAFRAGREKELLFRACGFGPIHTTPVAANGVLYVASDRRLCALQAAGASLAVAESSPAPRGGRVPASPSAMP